MNRLKTNSVRSPLPVRLVGILFIGAGLVGIAYHLPELWEHGSSPGEVILGLMVRLLAVVGGILLLLGKGWARWILVGWMSYHVILSYFHSGVQMATHTATLVVIVYALFRTQTREYFARQLSAGQTTTSL